MSVHSKFKWLAYLCYYGPAKPGDWGGYGSTIFYVARKKRKQRGKNKEFQNENY